MSLGMGSSLLVHDAVRNSAAGMGTKGAGVMRLIVDWASKAACKQADPDSLFVQGAAQNRAKAVCMGCPVRTECLADALDNRVEFGVWGGMTERERRALLRRRPDVVSWWKLLDAARRAYETNPTADAATAFDRELAETH